MNKCATQQGVDATWAPSLPEIGGSRLYGVWLRDHVATAGYDIPTTPEHDALLAANSTPFTDEALAIYEACYEQDDIQLLAEEAIAITFPLGEETTGIAAAALESEDAQAVFTEWDACLARSGLERNPSVDPYQILGTSMDPTEQNITIALKDVACKEEVDFVARLATIEASFQQPIITKYEVELTALRAEYDGLIERSRVYLNANRPSSSS